MQVTTTIQPSSPLLTTLIMGQVADVSQQSQLVAQLLSARFQAVHSSIAYRLAVVQLTVTVPAVTPGSQSSMDAAAVSGSVSGAEGARGSSEWVPSYALA